ncbi:MAG: mannose-1-phosphate guanylyltransferase/mannose-6-phosphate isomerase [Legionellales bacterium RIFCSPHIGHO2_12_FULL_35_11]|nr:MAG: mannose-1-phosphate guanylyltransferase/mannose-6-phosphate isomerase [Legionellales bacterium RIFCSPHIGHO2_12_FULL_35_11]
MQLIPTILCGGAGSRLWPVSRELHPKPFIRLKDDGLSLLQKAFLRGANLKNVVEILTVTNTEFNFKIEEEFRKINNNKLQTSFILEPLGRNTAAAITAASLEISRKYGDNAILLILAADHLITNQDEFQKAVTTAMEIATSEKLVTFGMQPHEPNTGYGYIEAEGHDVLRFVEKPNLQLAKEYLATKRFLWNSGMFLFSAKTILDEISIHCPQILACVSDCLAASHTKNNRGYSELLLEPDTFSLVEDQSIDYAVMEKSKNIAVVPCDIGWTDVGSWEALGEMVLPDNAGNRISGESVLHEVTNCYIQSDERLIGAVGVDNLLIIDTPDALLVADKSRSQDVKYLYAELKKLNHEVYKIHRTVHRPWGTYTILEESANFKIKRIVVQPGASLSLQMHHHRSEHWIVVSGMAKVVNGDKIFFVHTNESTYIPAGHKHRLENPGVLDLVMIEVQSGEYLGEDDIVRFEDNYGRLIDSDLVK